MIFEETPIPKLFVTSLKTIEDERGFFARVWCSRELAEQGLPVNMVQCNLSYNRKAGTLRGLHMQRPPDAETKLVRCVRGAIFDVAVDLRPQSPTYCQWFGIELNQNNRKMLHIPEGCSHGYLTLTDDTEVLYHVTAFYAPEAEAPLRWDDPVLAIDWPRPIEIISEKDRRNPCFDRQAWESHLINIGYQFF